jgi:uncharacterized protein (DUF885 family)
MHLFLAWSLVYGSRAFGQAPNAALQELGAEFFRWRGITQPCTPDDIPRIERSKGWVPSFSSDSLQAMRDRYTDFRQRLDAVGREGWTRSDSVDYLLLRSAIERVHWELDVLRAPYRDPGFYVHQTLGAVYDLLLPQGAMTKERAGEIVVRLQSIPSTLRAGRENLTEPVKPFAAGALRALDGVRKKLDAMVEGLKPVVPKDLLRPLSDAARTAADSLEDFAVWLKEGSPEMTDDVSIGRRAYEYYLRTIALNPVTTDQMLASGQSEFERAAAFEGLERVRNARLPERGLFKSTEQQIEQAKTDELAIRKFLTDRKLLTIPMWVKQYANRASPAYVAPLAGLGVADDLTSPSRLTENAVSYIPAPSASLSYFFRASAQDPRPIILHEGVPGHYFQLVRSWNNPNPLRRHYFDSGSNEGWGFYVEEMMLQAGLFDADRPRTRETIYSFMRLRALRVAADVKLALGDFTIDQAAAYLASMVPMDMPTAGGEAAFFAATPGQAIGYQIGKLQILKLISDARVAQGKSFDLRAIHDYIAVNGNVPIALLRWEYLGLRDEIEDLW